MPESRVLPVSSSPVPGGTASPARFALGIARIDAALGGGLARARLHELYPANEDDMGAAAGFALMLALRAGGRQGPFVWIAEDRLEKRFGRLHAPGVAELGGDPARLLFVDAPDEKALLRIAADVVRSPAAGVAVIALAGPAPAFDLTATRRLTLFAERSGVTAILLRSCAPQEASAAATRWRVTAAPSTPLEADAPGHTALLIELERQRGGAPVPALRVEWDRDARAFAPPLPGDLAAVPGGGQLAAG